jgi:hypothetical protein
MSVREELLALQQSAPDGLLRVETAVEWAENNPRSDLHKSLEWDDAAAGHDWRCHQVRRLIAIHIVNVEGVREMVSLSIDRTEPGGGYRPLNSVLEVPRLRRVLLADALAELDRVKDRYETVADLAEVWDAIDAAKHKHGRGGKDKGGRRGASPAA